MRKFFCLCLFVPLFSLAAIYEGTDAHGVPFFSDSPAPDTKSVKLNESQVVTLENFNPPEQNKADAASKTLPSLLEIVTPRDQQTFWNQNQIELTVRMSPALASGNLIQPLLDGMPLGKASTNLSVMLPRLERGRHHLSVRMVDATGKVIQQSKTVTIYVHQTKFGGGQVQSPGNAISKTQTKPVQGSLPQIGGNHAKQPVIQGQLPNLKRQGTIKSKAFSPDAVIQIPVE